MDYDTIERDQMKPGKKPRIKPEDYKKNGEPLEDYYDTTLKNIENFIPSGINPDNNAFFEERSNPLSSKGD